MIVTSRRFVMAAVLLLLPTLADRSAFVTLNRTP